MKTRHLLLVLLGVLALALAGAYAMTLPTSGGPDHGVLPYQTAMMTADSGDLAALALGFARIDGRGRVLFADLFAQGMQAWTPSRTPAGNGYDPILTSSYPVFISPNAIKLHPGPTAGQNAQLYRNLTLGQTTRLGIEAALFAFDTNGAKLTIQAQYSYAGTQYKAWLSYDPPTSNWIITTDLGDVVILNLPVNYSWVQAKVVADFSTGKYVRALVGETELDLSAYNLVNNGASVGGVASFAAIAFSQGAATTPVRMGAAIFTRDEP
jgi:hypothetical protein